MGLTSAALTVLAGWLIGATGIGGVLVVPMLIGLEGVELSQAIAASSLAFALPGAAALWRLRRSGKAKERSAENHFSVIAVVLGALPGALLGAWLVHQVDVSMLLAGLAVLALFSGVRGLLSKPALLAMSLPIPVPLALALGALVGLGSGLTGTGGPVLLVPLLMALRQPLLGVVVAAQAIQLPVALSASLAHASSGTLDWSLALSLGLLLLLGSLLGQWSTSRIQTHHLQKLVSVLLIACGLWFAWRIFHG